MEEHSINETFGSLHLAKCNMDYFNVDDYIEKCKKQIIKLRVKEQLSKEQARELWSFFTEELDTDSFDLVLDKVMGNKLLNELYDGEVYYSEFAPEKDYSPNNISFATKVFPMFVEILKKELEEAENAGKEKVC